MMTTLRQRRPGAELELLVGLGGAAAALALGYGMSRFGLTYVAAGVFGAAILGASLVRIEVGFAALFAAALIAPAFVGYGAWTPALLLVVGVVALKELMQTRLVAIWNPIVVYCLAYLLVGVHGELTAAFPQAMLKYVLPPFFALATAVVARDPGVRRRLLLLLCVGVSVQIVFAGVQTVQGIGTYGRAEFLEFSDLVTGTLGSSASGLLTLISVAVATVLFAMSLERVWRPKLLMIGALVLSFVGIISVARAVFVFVPVAFACVLLAGGLFARRSLGLRRVLLVATVLLALTPGLVVAMSTLYPGVTQDLNSVSKVRDYLFLDTTNSGPTPGRGQQLAIAIDEYKEFTPSETALGKGVGTTWIEADSHFVSSEDAPIVISSRQFANSVWVPRVLIEGGLVGLLAFAGLLAAVVNLTRRTRPRIPARTSDAAIVLAMPGLVGLTFVAAFYLPVLSSPPFATIFWTLLGIALAISRSYPQPGD